MALEKAPWPGWLPSYIPGLSCNVCAPISQVRKLILLKVNMFAELPQLVNADTGIGHRPTTPRSVPWSLGGVWRVSEPANEVGLLSQIILPAPADPRHQGAQGDLRIWYPQIWAVRK